MANIDAPRGFEPIQPNGGSVPTRRYQITASYATALYLNEPVAQVAGGGIERATAGAGNPILGSIQGFLKDGTGPQSYFPASSTGTWYAEVADDPGQHFVIQEDGAVTPLTAADRGGNVNIIFTHAGSTVTGISGAEIDSDSVNTTANFQVRLVDIVDSPDNAIGANAKWIVKINNHQGAPGIVGVGI